MSLTVYYLCGASLVIVLSRIIEYYTVTFRLRRIPTVGSSSIFSYYLNALDFRRRAREIIQEGYDKYPGSAFKVSEMNQWFVIVSGDMIEDMRRATDDQLSFTDTLEENSTFQMKYIFGKDFNQKQYHVDIIRGALTRNIAIQFGDVRDEILAAFGDEIPLTTDWRKTNLMQSIRHVVSRTTNRLFVGLPLCRDPEYRELNITFTGDVVDTSRFISNFPRFMRSFAVQHLSNVPKEINKAVKLLTPLIEARLKQDEKCGKDWEGRPNDLISWLLDAAPPDEKNIYAQVLRILLINFAAIHTTSITFTNAFYYLAAYPEYMKPLREEIENAVNEEGWSKVAMGRMRKLDSFLKEAQRHSGGVGGLSMTRKVLKDFTFSNGLTIPAGTYLASAAYPIHTDDTIYPDAHKFKPFRFSELREGESIKHQMVTPNNDYLLFGQGRHACPGRFFAVNEIKVMVAHVILTYDVRFGDDQKGPPPSMWHNEAVFPDDTKEVLFRARVS